MRCTVGDSVGTNILSSRSGISNSRSGRRTDSDRGSGPVGDLCGDARTRRIGSPHHSSREHKPYGSGLEAVSREDHLAESVKVGY